MRIDLGIVAMVCFIVFGAVAFYTRLMADYIFSRLEYKYPEYYQAIGRPYHGLNARRSGIAEGMLLRFFYRGIPADFPRDEELRGIIRKMKIAGWALGIPSWIIIGTLIVISYLNK